MPLSVGDKIGHYEVTSLLGQGGMGEVFRARDTKLKREVAIKVLPEAFARDPERMSRFQREAEVLASLNHPNIATIHGVEDRALVMELVEGTSPKGPLPFDEAWKIASQIAAALEYAHERGIMHRDLKPANIMITPDGVVKLLDFGLAKAFSNQKEPSASPENSPTLTLGATEVGVILGTAAYMAPEQARGKTVDKRADIWSFGVVLYELLTGERLFTGEDAAETLAAVIHKQPDLDKAPVQARKLLRRCLEKDPKKRLRDIGETRYLLEDVGQAPSLPTQGTAPHHWGWLSWSIAALSLLALAAGAVWHFKPGPPLAITRFAVPLGEGQRFTTRNRSTLAISPDGTQIAYTANSKLYLRAMSEPEARPVPGTDIGNRGTISMPVFSPDGKSLVFYSGLDLALKKTTIGGGAAVTICKATDPFGVTLGADGIVFVEPGKGILRVSANGGTPELLVALKDGEQVEGPQTLPGGQAVLFSMAAGANAIPGSEKSQVVVQTLKSGARKVLLESAGAARYLPTGHLVYAIGGVLYAVPFDVKRLEITGGPVGVVEGVERGGSGNANFAFSDNGSLIYVPGPISSNLVGQDALALVDRKGVAEPLKLQPGTYGFPRVSRDGKRVAYEADDGRTPSIWTYELSETNSANHLTLAGANRYPIWSSDNEWVAFQSDREGDLGIWRQRADGTGTAERLTKPEKGISHIPDSWSPDGQTFSYTEVKGDTEAVWTFSLRDKKAMLFAEAPSSRLGRSVFSPDGHWIAYQARDAQTVEIYVKPFPPTATTYQISKEGNGHLPVWSPDGKELFYVAGAGAFASVSVTTKPSFTHGSPVTAPPGFRVQRDNFVRPYDILPNGKFIGMVAAGQPQAGQAPTQIQVVLNWFEDVKQRASVH